MDFFISPAMAQGGGAEGGGFNFLIFTIVLIGIFWFMVIRPQQKQFKAHREMLSALQAGDEVVTNGGDLGRINWLTDTWMGLQVTPEQEWVVQRQFVAHEMPRGTVEQAWSED